MWNKGWDKIFKENEWGKYPPEELIRFIARNYYCSPNRKDIKILEVGSGTGANLCYLAREGFDATGIDGSKIGVEKTRKRLTEESLTARVETGDIISLPFEDDSFDCVVDNECIYANSYEDSRKIMAEIHRVLKPKGKFFSKTFMTGTYGDKNGKRLEGEQNTYLELYEGALKKGYGIIRFTEEKEIKALYKNFNIVSIDYVVRSERDRKYEVKEWIIVCSKE